MIYTSLLQLLKFLYKNSDFFFNLLLIVYFQHHNIKEHDDLILECIFISCYKNYFQVNTINEKFNDPLIFVILILTKFIIQTRIIKIGFSFFLYNICGSSGYFQV